MTAPWLPENPEDFDAVFAAELVGCTLIIGVTRVDLEGASVEQRQYFGVVVRCSLEEGLAIRMTDGSEYETAPATAWIQPARPGEYRLRSTGEVVIDPDYVMTFISQAPGLN